jgi:formate dehydrogenase subunit gamma
LKRTFGGRTIGSVAVYLVISALCLVWLVTLVVIPVLTTTVEYSLQYAVSLGFDLLITILIILAILHNGLDLMGKANKGVRKFKGGIRIKRLSLNQRVQHLWVLATFTVAALTGFAQMYYDSWGKLVIVPLGGLSVSSDLHLAAAFLMGVLMVYHFAFYCAQYLSNRALGLPARLDIMLGRKDIADFLQNMRHMLGGKERPRFEKYSYAQKFDYWGVYWGMLILGIPGVMMWAYGPGFMGELPFIFHVKEALLAVLWLVVFHFYQSHFNPRDFPMNGSFLSGKISEQEMMEDHPLEFERIRT